MSHSDDAAEFIVAAGVIVIFALVGVGAAGYKALRTDLKFGLQELNITCTGQKGEDKLTCTPGVLDGGNGTACVIWPTAFKANFGRTKITVCTREGRVEDLNIAQIDTRYDITIKGRAGEFDRSAFYPAEE